jgi:hypothetical protein
VGLSLEQEANPLNNASNPRAEGHPGGVVPVQGERSLWRAILRASVACVSRRVDKAAHLWKVMNMRRLLTVQLC